MAKDRQEDSKGLTFAELGEAPPPARWNAAVQREAPCAGDGMRPSPCQCAPPTVPGMRAATAWQKAADPCHCPLCTSTLFWPASARKQVFTGLLDRGGSGGSDPLAADLACQRCGGRLPAARPATARAPRRTGAGSLR